MKNFIIYSALVLSLSSCSVQKDITKPNETPVLISDRFSFTEGPSADLNGNVFFTDQPNDKIYEWNCETNQISEFLNKTGRANGTYIDSEGNLLTCSDENGEILSYSKNKVKTVLLSNFNGKRLNGPNDLWIDKGFIYFTDPLYVRDYWKNFKQEIDKENLYLRKPNGEIITVDTTFVKPNGIIGNAKKMNFMFLILVPEKPINIK
nr:SMP-30/gluconolactonase/LRE family protein [Halpernia frigidisoli]